MQILINHIGYDINKDKKAIIQSNCKIECQQFNIVSSGKDKVEYTGEIENKGNVIGWKNRFFARIDFSQFKTKGSFYIVVDSKEGGAKSEEFSIDKDLIRNETLPWILSYFSSQRPSEQYEERDSKTSFFGGIRNDLVDVHGGWYDASGDVSKYLSHLSYANFMNPQQTPLVVWSLATVSQNDIPDSLKSQALEEAIHGADFLCRMQDKAGYFYMNVFDQWTSELDQREICSYKTQAGEKMTSWQAGFRQGGGMTIAALAKVSGLEKQGEFSSKVYLETAIKGYDHLIDHNQEYLDDGKENIIDDYSALMAAIELHKKTKSKQYKEDAELRVTSLIGRISRDEHYDGFFIADGKKRPFFHASDAGLPLVSLIEFYLNFKASKQRVGVCEAIIFIIKFYLKITDEIYNPFGYSRQYVQPLNGTKKSAFFFPHTNESGYWWQGENATIASLATAFGMVLKSDIELDLESSVKQRIKSFICDQQNWILGLNPFDICMLDGKGRNNPQYIEEGVSMNKPGGICNGITSDFENETDIAFVPEKQGFDPEHSWRWLEQWLPHAAWYITTLI